MNVPLHRAPFHAECERMVPTNLVHHIIEDPRRTDGDVRVRGPVAVGYLIESSERKCWQRIRRGCAVNRNLWQRVRPLQEGQVLRAITLVAIQVSEGSMVSHSR